jgi:hypothetical protein
MIAEILQEIAELEQRVKAAERQLKVLTREDIQRFRSGRYLASWLGITARESSSGARRRLGRISKRGDVYLRTLLIHGARSVLNATIAATNAGAHSIDCALGPSPPSSAAVTTKPPSLSPTSLLASPGRLGSISASSIQTG